MVRDVEPVLPPPPPLLLSLLPHAATPKARATVRQLEAATERTRKIPSSGNSHQSGRDPIPGGRYGAMPTPLTPDYRCRWLGGYRERIRAVAPSTRISAVIMKASNDLTLSDQRTIQTTNPKTAVRTRPMRAGDYRSAPASPSTSARTSSPSAAARTSRDPTITPSAPAAAAWAACSGVAMPNPRATGTSVCERARSTVDANVSLSAARSPVVPATETV